MTTAQTNVIAMTDLVCPSVRREVETIIGAYTGASPGEMYIAKETGRSRGLHGYFHCAIVLNAGVTDADADAITRELNDTGYSVSYHAGDEHGNFVFKCPDGIKRMGFTFGFYAWGQ